MHGGSVGPERSDGRPANALRSYVVQRGRRCKEHVKYFRKALETKGGRYHLLTNNCCHWAQTVITEAGGSWPAEPINWGFNTGRVRREGRFPLDIALHALRMNL
jgi:hypothetical protein